MLRQLFIRKKIEPSHLKVDTTDGSTKITDRLQLSYDQVSFTIIMKVYFSILKLWYIFAP